MAKNPKRDCEMLGLALGFATLCLPVEALGAQERVVAIEGAAWTHPHMQIELPPTLAGLTRKDGVAYAGNLLDVSFTYSSPDKRDNVTVYLFRNTLGDGSMWMNQARLTIEARDIFAGPQLAYPVAPFGPSAAPGAGAVAIYRTGSSSALRSTGVAFFEIGDWYVKLRASSAHHQPEGLRALMAKFVDEIPWLAAGAGFPTTDIAQCPEPLHFDKDSKNVRSSGADALMQSLIGASLEQAMTEPGTLTKAKTRASWCIDSTPAPFHTVYRDAARQDAYVLASGDAGRGLMVEPERGLSLIKAAQGRKPTKPKFQVKLVMPEESVLFVLQDRMPAPTRAMEIAESNQIVSRVKTWGKEKEIQISSDAIK